MGVVVSAGKQFTPAPDGVHAGVCCDIIDLGMVTTQWEGKERTSHKVYLVWQIGAVNEETGERFTVRRRYTASLHEKADLRKNLQSWRGRPFTNEELASFDLDRVIGVGALLNIVHTMKDGNTWANVEAIMPLPKGQEPLKIQGYIRDKDKPKDRSEGASYQATDDDVPFAVLLAPLAGLVLSGLGFLA
jgi:hypothetical protein